MRVLISTAPDDFHAAAVAFALRCHGHVADLWHHADFPVRQTFSIEIDDAHVGRRGDAFRPIGGDGVPSTPDAVWFRRPGVRDVEAADGLDPADVPHAKLENALARRANLATLAPGAFWINPYHASLASENKGRQLALATEVGLRVPRTLISNDPQRIRAFLDELRDGGVVYKPFAPINWLGESTQRTVATVEIDARALPRDDLLRLCSGIYQRKLEKQADLRLTFMGHHCLAVRIERSDGQSIALDWRSEACAALRHVPVDVPAAIHAKCVALMERLDIVFGCFDFVIDGDGRWQFLEVNPAGQFLWVELQNPDVPMLATFCDFLVARDRRYAGPRSGSPRWPSVQEAIVALKRPTEPAIAAA